MPASFKADLFYGASGTTKTSNIGRAALYILKKYGKRTRLVSADGGGWEPIDPLVQEGIVIPWAIRLRQHRVETMDKACQGYWPRDVENPLSVLEPPTVRSYTAECHRCRVDGKPTVIFGPASTTPTNLICPKCKATIGTREIDVHISEKQHANPANDLRDIGLVAYEGLTSFGDSVLEYLMATKASLSQDPSYNWTDGSSVYSGGNMTYYGFVQNRLYEWVHKTHMIPFVEKVIWTALEGKGEEEATKVPIFGPAIAGKKATGKAPQWFGNTLHFESVQEVTATMDENKQVRVINKPVMYLRNHAEPISKVPFQCKTRAPFQLYHELPEFMDADVGKLYEKLDELHDRIRQQIQKQQAAAAQPAAK